MWLIILAHIVSGHLGQRLVGSFNREMAVGALSDYVLFDKKFCPAEYNRITPAAAATAATPTDCANLCSARTKCTSFLWVTSGPVEGQDDIMSQCHLSDTCSMAQFRDQDGVQAYLKPLSCMNIPNCFTCSVSYGCTWDASTDTCTDGMSAVGQDECGDLSRAKPANKAQVDLLLQKMKVEHPGPYKSVTYPFASKLIRNRVLSFLGDSLAFRMQGSRKVEFTSQVIASDIMAAAAKGGPFVLKYVIQPNFYIDFNVVDLKNEFLKQGKDLANQYAIMPMNIRGFEPERTASTQVTFTCESRPTGWPGWRGIFNTHVLEKQAMQVQITQSDNNFWFMSTDNPSLKMGWNRIQIGSLVFKNLGPKEIVIHIANEMGYSYLKEAIQENLIHRFKKLDG